MCTDHERPRSLSSRSYALICRAFVYLVLGAMLWLMVLTLPFWCTPPPHVPTKEVEAVLSALMTVYFFLALVTSRTISQLDNACKLASPSVLGHRLTKAHNEPAWRR